MVNPRKAATTMAISLVAIGSLAFAGPATAEAMSSTAASHQTAGARPAAAQHIVCARHQAILREMRRTIAAYEDTSRSYAHLLGSARRAGPTCSARITPTIWSITSTPRPGGWPRNCLSRPR